MDCLPITKDAGRIPTGVVRGAKETSSQTNTGIFPRCTMVPLPKKKKEVSMALAIMRLDSAGCAVRRRKWREGYYQYM